MILIPSSHQPSPGHTTLKVGVQLLKRECLQFKRNILPPLRLQIPGGCEVPWSKLLGIKHIIGISKNVADPLCEK